jgi:hypothetical protein
VPARGIAAATRGASICWNQNDGVRVGIEQVFVRRHTVRQYPQVLDSFGLMELPGRDPLGLAARSIR